MITAHFIRHAESESNAGLRTEHPATTPITERGVEQAHLTSQIFKAAPDLIVTSPYIRTKQTAAPLMERFPNVPCAEWPVQEFTYLDPVHWNGTTYQERKPIAHAYWERSDPFSRDGGIAESFVDLIERAEHTQQLILEQKAQTIVVYSHGHFARTFWWRMALPHLKIEPDIMKRFIHFMRGVPFPNCARLTFRFDEGNPWIGSVDIAHIPLELLTY